MAFTDLYRQKLTSAESAVAAVKSGDWVDFGSMLLMPEILDRALAARKDELSNVKIRGLLAYRPLITPSADPTGKAFSYNSWFMSSIERKLSDQGFCHLIPMSYRNKPDIYRRYLDIDVAMLQLPPMDNKGYFNFSVANCSTAAMLSKSKKIIVEVNENLPPVCFGAEGQIHVSEVDMIVEGDHDRLPQVVTGPASETEMKIAQLIAEQVEDGSNLQIGVGSLPAQIGEILAGSNLKDLGIHTELIGPSFLKLAKSGVVTNKRKKLDQGISVWTLCAGDDETYDWVRNNPELNSYPVDYTNGLHVLAQTDKLITVNNCVEADLFGQICSESSGTRQISGSGGQLDFLQGSFLSKGGKSFICMSSTFFDKRENRFKSRIVPTLPNGSTVTDPRSVAFYLVTEWGIANLMGKSLWERAEAIISIAHPDFRDSLIQDAESLGIWRKSNR
jgi:butyryl-CoA:acetate CoA-transferase